MIASYYKEASASHKGKTVLKLFKDTKNHLHPHLQTTWEKPCRNLKKHSKDQHYRDLRQGRRTNKDLGTDILVTNHKGRNKIECETRYVRKTKFVHGTYHNNRKAKQVARLKEITWHITFVQAKSDKGQSMGSSTKKPRRSWGLWRQQRGHNLPTGGYLKAAIL